MHATTSWLDFLLRIRKILPFSPLSLAPIKNFSVRPRISFFILLTFILSWIRCSCRKISSFSRIRLLKNDRIFEKCYYSIWLSVFLSIYWSMYLSVHQSFNSKLVVNISNYLSIHLPASFLIRNVTSPWTLMSVSWLIGYTFMLISENLLCFYPNIVY